MSTTTFLKKGQAIILIHIVSLLQRDQTWFWYTETVKEHYTLHHAAEETCL